MNAHVMEYYVYLNRLSVAWMFPVKMPKSGIVCLDPIP